MRELYQYPKVAYLQDLVGYLEKEGVSKEATIKSLSDINKDGDLSYRTSVMVGLLIKKATIGEVATEGINPVLSFCNNRVNELEFVKKYRDFSDPARTIKQTVKRELGEYYEASQTKLM